MKVDLDNFLPPGRPTINLHLLLDSREHPESGNNLCKCASLTAPQSESHQSLVKGMRRILPFMYRRVEQVIETLARYGMDFAEEIPLPTSFKFQWAHAGEILMCAYYEECEQATVLTYKWRLNTTKNQHQLGMDLLAFDLKINPPKIYTIAVKTTDQGDEGNTPSVIYDAISELKAYLSSEKLDDDLEIMAANLHTDENHRNVFLAWYDPYTQSVPATKPEIIPVVAIVIDEKNWRDKYARPAIRQDFGVPGAVRILSIAGLTEFVQQTYA